MKPYDNLSARGKFIRKNGARLVIYGGAILICCHSCYRIKKMQQRNMVLPVKEGKLASISLKEMLNLQLWDNTKKKVLDLNKGFKQFKQIL